MADLDDTDLAVLRMLAEGKSTLECAARLEVSDRTVKSYVNALVTKLGARNRTNLVAIALRKGLIR